MRSPFSSRGPGWLPYVLVTAAALGIYANSLDNGFVWDDRELVLNQPAVQSVGNIPDFFTSALFTGGEGAAYFRPVVTTTLAVDYAIGGPSQPWVFHLTNVLLYAATCAAVLALFRRLIGPGPAALGGALLFAAHAVHTESVAWISGRSDVLAALFMVLALLSLLHREDHVGAGDAGEGTGWLPRGAALPLAGACTLLALLSKEVALVLPLLCVLLWFRQPGRSPRGLLAPLCAVGLGVLAYMALRWNALAGLSTGMASGQVSPWNPAGLATVGHCVLRYVGKLAVPLHLSADFEVQPFRSALSAGALGSLAGSLVLLVLTGIAAWKDRKMGFALGLMWLGLAPVLHVVPIAETTAERFLFVPSIGFCLLAACGVRRAASAGDRSRAGLVAASALVLWAAGHGLMAADRNPDWKTDRTLALSSLRTAPETPRSHLAMGMVYENEGRYARARRRYLQFLRLAPTSRAGRVRLGKICLKMGDHREALVHLLKTSPRRSGNAVLMVDVAHCYMAVARLRNADAAWKQARRWARSAIEADSSHGPAYGVLGYWRLHSGKTSKGAARMFRKAADLSSDSARSDFYTGLALRASGNAGRAVEAYRQALRRRPRFARAHYELARALRQRGNYRKALRRARMAYKIQPSPVFRALIADIERELNAQPNGH